MKNLIVESIENIIKYYEDSKPSARKSYGSYKPILVYKRIPGCNTANTEVLGREFADGRMARGTVFSDRNEAIAFAENCKQGRIKEFQEKLNKEISK